MVNITVVELHVEDGSFSANLPFGSSKGGEDEEDEEEVTEEEDDAGSRKGLALVGVLLFLIAGAALVKYLSGEDEDHEVSIETEDDSVDVSIDD